MAQQTFTDCFTLAVGCILYTSNSGTTPVAAGYYSNGYDCYTVNGSGVITSIGVCPTSTTTSTTTTAAPTTTTSTSTTSTTAPTTTTSTSTTSTSTTSTSTTSTSTTSTTAPTTTTTTTVAPVQSSWPICGGSELTYNGVYSTASFDITKVYRFSGVRVITDGVNPDVSSSFAQECHNHYSGSIFVGNSYSLYITSFDGPYIDCAECNAVPTTTTTSTSTTTTLAALAIEVTLVGGGGGSGWSAAGVYPTFPPDNQGSGGGGGAGRYVTYTASLSNGTYPITIGTGGAAGVSGSVNPAGGIGTNTVFQTNVAPGGGGGGAGLVGFINGAPGGSGGGGGNMFVTINPSPSNGGAAVLGSGGLNITGSGNAGGNNSGTVVFGDSGGGAGGPAGVFGIYALGVYGSNGKLYAQGGAGGRTGYGQLTTSGSGGSNPPAAAAGGMPGLPGIGLIRYLGAPVATGGAISTSGSYTYHTFTSSSNFIY
jgi:hypothetical protein